MTEELNRVIERLDRIEAAITALLDWETVRDWYTAQELARLLEKAEFTVREWCRLGRLTAQ